MLPPPICTTPIACCQLLLNFNLCLCNWGNVDATCKKWRTIGLIQEEGLTSELVKNQMDESIQFVCRRQLERHDQLEKTRIRNEHIAANTLAHTHNLLKGCVKCGTASFPHSTKLMCTAPAMFLATFMWVHQHSCKTNRLAMLLLTVFWCFIWICLYLYLFIRQIWSRFMYSDNLPIMFQSV